MARVAPNATAGEPQLGLGVHSIDAGKAAAREAFRPKRICLVHHADGPQGPIKELEVDPAELGPAPNTQRLVRVVSLVAAKTGWELWALHKLKGGLHHRRGAPRLLREIFEIDGSDLADGMELIALAPAEVKIDGALWCSEKPGGGTCCAIT